jgi:hypothetical protein
MVPRGGFEPPTPAFSVQCSTPELPGRRARQTADEGGAAGYKGSIPGCPERPARPFAAPDGPSGPGIAGLQGGHALLVLRLLPRHDIDLAQPAVEIDIGAAPAAERPEFFRGRLAADRAGLGARDVGVLRHAANIIFGSDDGRLTGVRFPQDLAFPPSQCLGEGTEGQRELPQAVFS